MPFSEQELWIAMATLLWTFELLPPLDAEGNAVLPLLDEWVDAGGVM